MFFTTDQTVVIITTGYLKIVIQEFEPAWSYDESLFSKAPLRSQNDGNSNKD